MNIAIVGGRNFEDFDLLEKVILDFISAGNHIDSIVSGGAKGADSLAEKFAEKHAVKTTVFKPDYKRYGRAATVIRNTQIIENSDFVFAFWDGHSKGTRDSIKKAEISGKGLSVHFYNNYSSFCNIVFNYRQIAFEIQ